MRILADSCGYLRILADFCGKLRIFADGVADSCGNLRTSLRILRMFVGICGFLKLFPLEEFAEVADFCG